MSYPNPTSPGKGGDMRSCFAVKFPLEAHSFIAYSGGVLVGLYNTSLLPIWRLEVLEFSLTNNRYRLFYSTCGWGGVSTDYIERPDWRSTADKGRKRNE